MQVWFGWTPIYTSYTDTVNNCEVPCVNGVPMDLEPNGNCIKLSFVCVSKNDFKAINLHSVCRLVI